MLFDKYGEPIKVGSFVWLDGFHIRKTHKVLNAFVVAIDRLSVTIEVNWQERNEFARKSTTQIVVHPQSIYVVKDQP